jgi:hypothetical protein
MLHSHKKYQKKANDKFFLPKLITNMVIFVPVLAGVTVCTVATEIKKKVSNSETNKK